MFLLFLGYIVAKACASPRNSTWFTRPFLLVRGWGLRTRLFVPPTHPRPRKRIGGAVRVGSYRFVDLVCGKAAADQEAGRFASNLSRRITILC